MITLGDGAGDTVNGGSYDTITLGDGAGDTVSSPAFSSNDIITLGNGAGDTVSAGFSSVVSSASARRRSIRPGTAASVRRD